MAYFTAAQDEQQIQATPYSLPCLVAGTNHVLPNMQGSLRTMMDMSFVLVSPYFFMGRNEAHFALHGCNNKSQAEIAKVIASALKVPMAQVIVWNAHDAIPKQVLANVCVHYRLNDTVYED